MGTNLAMAEVTTHTGPNDVNELLLFHVKTYMAEVTKKKKKKIGDIPLICTLKKILFNRKLSFYYSNQQTFCINDTRSLFMFCTQKHLLNVTH